MAHLPRIGISLDTTAGVGGRRKYALGADYISRIEEAGGLPVPLTHTHSPELRRQLIAMLDGLIIPGGDDLDAKLWGETQHPQSVLMDQLRQDFDLALLSLAEARDLPTLGVCLGMQMMNVQRQGSLHQSLVEAFGASAVTHASVQDPATCNSSLHDVLIRPGTHLHAILKEARVPANSRHRQCVNRLGHGLIATAFAPDGIIEGIEDSSLLYWIGVQWHPENLAGSVHERLFAALVSAAGTYHERQIPAPRLVPL